MGRSVILTPSISPADRQAIAAGDENGGASSRLRPKARRPRHHLVGSGNFRSGSSFGCLTCRGNSNQPKISKRAGKAGEVRWTDFAVCPPGSMLSRILGTPMKNPGRRPGLWRSRAIIGDRLARTINPCGQKIGTAGRTCSSGSLPKRLIGDNGAASVSFRDLPIAAAESGFWMKLGRAIRPPLDGNAQEPTQSLAALHRPLAVDVIIAREQQDVVLPPMIALGIVMLDVFAQCAPWSARRR
jgi:hypothetical protein